MDGDANPKRQGGGPVASARSVLSLPRFSLFPSLTTVLTLPLRMPPLSTSPLSRSLSPSPPHSRFDRAVFSIAIRLVAFFASSSNPSASSILRVPRSSLLPPSLSLISSLSSVRSSHSPSRGHAAVILYLPLISNPFRLPNGQM